MTTDARLDIGPHVLTQASERPPANVRELEVYNKLRDDGYHVLCRGWPDLLAIKLKESRFFDTHWELEDVRMIEVKSPTDDPTVHQRAVLNVLNSLGHNAEVARYDGGDVKVEQMNRFGKVDTTQMYALRDGIDQSYRNMVHSVQDFRRKTAVWLPEAYDELVRRIEFLKSMAGEILHATEDKDKLDVQRRLIEKRYEGLPSDGDEKEDGW